jgi:hypothetical protein
MHMNRRCLAAFFAFFILTLQPGAQAQEPVRVAQIPGINPGPCNPGPEEKPWLNPNQTPGCRALEVIASMTVNYSEGVHVGYPLVRRL